MCSWTLNKGIFIRMYVRDVTGEGFPKDDVLYFGTLSVVIA